MVRRIVMVVVVVVFMVGLVPAHAQDSMHEVAARNRAAVHEALAQLAAGNVDGYLQLYANPFRTNQGDANLVNTAPADLQPFASAVLAAIPNLRAVPKVLIAQGDRVAVALYVTGTFSEPFSFAPFGPETYPPTNQRVSWTELHFLRFNDEGQVIEEWTVSDPTALLSALGVTPSWIEVDETSTPQTTPVGYQRLNADALAATYTSGREHENAALFREQLGLLDTGADTTAYYIEPFVSWAAGSPVEATADEDQQLVRALNEAMPDFNVKPEVVVAEGDWVAGLITITGTFTNALNEVDLGTIPPTGQSMVWQVGIIQRYAAGKVVEQWIETDPSPMFAALGLVPSMEEGG